MLFNDYTSVPLWQACRDRHIVLTSILDLHLYLWAYCYGLESYQRSYESVIAILYQSKNLHIHIIFKEPLVVSIIRRITLNNHPF
jgi:hypothetical protein